MNEENAAPVPDDRESALAGSGLDGQGHDPVACDVRSRRKKRTEHFDEAKRLSMPEEGLEPPTRGL
jgi:hypothetical protein